MPQHNTTPKTLSHVSRLTARPAITNRSGWHRAFRSLGLLCALGIMTPPAQAQVPKEISQVYDGYDLKNYCTVQQPGLDEYSMAGTMYDFDNNPGDHAAHLLMFDATSATPVSMVFNNPEYAERAVGMHYLNSGKGVIVTTYDPINGAPGNSGVQLITVDAAGNYLTNKVISVQNGIGINLRPLGTEIDPSGDVMYICGFMTTSILPGIEPTFADTKSAFLIRYDFVNDRVAAMKTYDWNGGPDDYDVAHRVKMLSDNTLWLGGMCNSASNAEVAMMNMIVDPVTLSPLVDVPLDIPAPLQPNNLKSTSFDIWEDPADPANAYIFSNYCAAHPSSIDIAPLFVNITSVDRNTLVPASGLNNGLNNQADYTWGTNVIMGNMNTSTVSSVILGGFQSFFHCGGQNNATSPDNINPYLAEMRLFTTTTGNLSIRTLYWSTIESLMGTGVDNTDPNSYPELGGGMSNLAWGPKTTVRYNNSPMTDIILNAPLWNPAPNRLNMKFIRTDMNGNPSCSNNYCVPSYLFYHVDAASNTVMEHNVITGEEQPFLAVTDVPADGLFDCTTGSTFYKKELNNVQTAVTGVSISPNPAHEYIQLDFKGTIKPSDNIKVQIYDVTGRVNNTLFEGSQSNMQSQITLPKLAPGVYMIRVQHNGNQLKSMPVVIQ
ncbi:T9SS type A sorting domain-containing protein [Edaphocola flava]|uniref:T9SS type A sorting domain-containing protein n=1 Tax=Edaphocola flava TaxID=2499629 RepID=UPI00100B49E0|nr:T9SS type A sorting domain-containing protein [Edaphocola flava]